METGFDAIDSKGKKVEVKTRRAPESKAKVIFKSFNFDYCLYIELNEYFEPVTVLKVFQDEIVKNVDACGDRLSVRKLKIRTINEKLY
ncbi:MAG: hypothetical protein IPK08_06240 [Bacteroidetes bacterium]|nr:hypothetical protein [Bacteroidota bacterium]